MPTRYNYIMKTNKNWFRNTTICVLFGTTRNPVKLLNFIKSIRKMGHNNHSKHWKLPATTDVQYKHPHERPFRSFPIIKGHSRTIQFFTRKGQTMHPNRCIAIGQYSSVFKCKYDGILNSSSSDYNYTTNPPTTQPPSHEKYDPQIVLTIFPWPNKPVRQKPFHTSHP